MINEVGNIDSGSLYSEWDSLSTERRVFHEHIFGGGNSLSFTKSIALCTGISRVEQRVQKAAYSASMGATVSGEVGVNVSWGDGVEVGGHASVSANDGKGNSVEATVEMKGDGSGSATVSAKHDEKAGS